MEILLDDIARTLCARSVTLPGSEEALIWEKSAASSGNALLDAHSAHQESDPKVSQQLPIELGKLNLDVEDTQRTMASSGRALKDTPSTSYSNTVHPLMQRSRTMGRQFA